MSVKNASNNYAIIIGIGVREGLDDSYMSTTSDDAIELEKYLHTLCNYPTKHILRIPSSLATANYILDSINNFANSTKQKKAETVIIYFSGHGDEKKFLVCQKDSKGKPTFLEGGKFIETINLINADKILIILDCCYAGGVATIPFDKDRFLRKKNRVIITSSHKSEVSKGGKPVSLFTYALIQAIAGSYLRGDEYQVKLFDLAMHLRERVNAISKRKQKPEIHAIQDSLISNFIISSFENGLPKKPYAEKAFILTDSKGEKIDTDISIKKDKKYRIQKKWIQKIENVKIENVKKIEVEIKNVGKLIVQEPFLKKLAERKAPLRVVFESLIQDRIKIFGGRELILKKIDSFVSAPEGGYLVITSPIGFGKTALIAKLISKNKSKYVYHFFAPSLGIHTLTEKFFLRNILEQLIAIQGLNIPIPIDLERLIALYHELIPKAHDIVIILDGIDEIQTWSFSPYVLPNLTNNIKIIVTIRDVDQSWKKQYSFPLTQTKNITMSGLKQNEIASVFKIAGTNAEALISSKESLSKITKVAEFSSNIKWGADPFYVRLLAEDAQLGKINKTNLEKRPTNLDDFLDQTWKEIKGTVQDDKSKELLGILSVTLGPISKQDLIIIIPELEDSWQNDFFEDTINHIQRFIISDINKNYSLAHPRLTKYLRTRIRSESFQKRLLEHCSLWKSNKSSYALTYYASHLINNERWDDFNQLILDSKYWSQKIDTISSELLSLDFEKMDKTLHDDETNKLDLNQINEIKLRVNGLTGFTNRTTELSNIEQFISKNLNRQLLISGKFGSGKTSLLNRVWFNNIQDRIIISSQTCISLDQPVENVIFNIIKNRKDKNIYALSQKNVSWNLLFQYIQKNFKKLTIIFDSLDEFPDNKLFSKFPSNEIPENLQFIWSSRPREHLIDMAIMANMEILELTNLQKEDTFDLIKKEFQKEFPHQKIPDKIINDLALRSAGNPGLGNILIQYTIQKIKENDNLNTFSFDSIPLDLPSYFQAAYRKIESDFGSKNTREIVSMFLKLSPPMSQKSINWSHFSLKFKYDISKFKNSDLFTTDIINNELLIRFKHPEASIFLKAYLSNNN